MQKRGKSLRPTEESFGLIAINPIHKKYVCSDAFELDYLPIKDVEEAIQAEACHIMAGQVLHNVHLVKHDDLRDERDRLQPQRERPGESPGCPAGVQDACEDQSYGNQNLEVRELVAQGVVSRAVWDLVLHQVDNQRSRCDKEDFHQRVVHRHKVEEQIFVSHKEDEQVDLLGLA